MLSFNAGNHKFWLGVNQFTDLTNDEFKATKTNKGLKRSGSRDPTGFKFHNVSTDALPTAVEWRTKGAVTPCCKWVAWQSPSLTSSGA